MNTTGLQARSARVLTAALAVLVVILSACGGAPAALLATISTPDAATPIQIDKAINITGKVSGGGLKSVDVYIDGVKYATVDTPGQNNEFSVSAPWTPAKAGAHVIQLKGLNDKGEVIVASEALFVTVQGSPATATAPPAPPTAAPTVAAAPTVSVTVATPVPAAAAAGPTVAVKEGDFVNVRKGPAVAFDKVGTLDKGISAPVKGKNTDGTWWQISFPAAPDGVGWVFGQLVIATGDTSKVAVAQAPVLPTSAATQPPAPTSPPPAAPTSSLPPSALLPYSQVMRFSPRDDIGDVPLGFNGAKQSTLVWEVNGAKSLELEITVQDGGGIFSDCTAGNLSTISPNAASGKRMPLAVPSGSWPFAIDGKGYYLFTIYVTKADGSQTTIPRNVIVDCYKK